MYDDNDEPRVTDLDDVIYKMDLLKISLRDIEVKLEDIEREASSIRLILNGISGSLLPMFIIGVVIAFWFHYS